MAVINRRNAVLGWAVWQLATRVAKQKAKSAVPSAENGSKWKKRAAVAGAGVAAAGAAAMFWRKAGSGSNGGSPTDE